MNTVSERFEELVPRLAGIVSRALGSEREMQAVLAEARQRWADCTRAGIEPDAALLTMITMRLVIEHRRARPPQPTQAPRFFGSAMPRAVAQPAPDRADDIAVTLFTLLEIVEPQARAALLLRGAFAAEYPEIADLIGRSEADCRALVGQAKSQLRAQLFR